jgi:hypothetical protein
MNNIERYEAFNKKLREILTLYEEVYFRNDGTYNIDSRTYELFEENPSALFVVFAEFCPKNDEELGRVKIHYDIKSSTDASIKDGLKYGGTNDFNNLLDKYNMEMEWDNSCIFLIYDAIDELHLIHR